MIKQKKSLIDASNRHKGKGEIQCSRHKILAEHQLLNSSFKSPRIKSTVMWKKQFTETRKYEPFRA